jgi:hypothetical protein
MTKKKYLLWFVFLWFCLFLAGETGSSELKEPRGITLTWQDFRELLGLDTEKIKITWEEFRKLLAQTGNPVSGEADIRDGVVTLKKEHFDRLLKKMRPPLEKIPAPPREYLVNRAAYKGTAANTHCRFEASFNVYLFRRETPGYVNIPVLSTRVALAEISVDGNPAFIQSNGSWYSVSLGKSGYHQVKALFAIAHNRQAISLPVAPSTINQIDFFIPQKDIEIHLPSSLNARTTVLPTGTRFSASIPLTRQIAMTWKRKLEKREKKPALFNASTSSLVSAASDIVKVKTRVTLEILQHSLEQISLLVPEKDEIIRVEAQSLDNWHVRETDTGKILEIYFGYDIGSNFSFTVYSERILAAGTLGVDYTGLHVIDARRQKGSIGITAESDVEVQVQASQGLEKQEFHQIPREILNMSSRPVLYAFKYAQLPFSLDLVIDKHERLEGITTVIESARATALFLEEGKALYRMIYTIRNSFKQFMELELPENAGIWTVLVDNQREKASRSKTGKILIPLVRSPGNGEQLRAFNVELIYTLPSKNFALSGRNECLLPGSDIFTNKMRVVLYLPQGFSYRFAKGKWKAEPRVLKKEVKKDRSKPAAPPAVEAEEPQDEGVAGGISGTLMGDDVSMAKSGETVQRELMKPPPAPGKRIKEKVTVTGMTPTVTRTSTAVTGPVGLDSINVRLPLSGIKYEFSKKIIDKEEKAPLTFSYYSINLQKAILYFIILAASLALILILLGKLKRKTRKQKSP